MTDVSEDMTHAPNCPHPGTTTTHGHSVAVTRCHGCGAITTTRKQPGP
jgi:ribosomal protein S27E